MLQPQVFKAGDLRGLVGGAAPEWDADGARAVGSAFAEAFGLAGKEFLLGRDMRNGGAAFSRAFADGAMRQGAGVVDIGLASTDEVWFASGRLGLAAAQFTASHNPSDYNGIKFSRPGAKPITAELMTRIRELSAVELPAASRRASLRHQDVLADYAAYLHSLVRTEYARRLTVVVDAGNGMAGHTVPAVLGALDIDLIGLYLELDGNFPNHPPNPLEPANLIDARRAVRDHHADLGLVFDGDADRCFVIDDQGDVVPAGAVAALLARSELAREPGATIVVNSITSAAVGDVVAEVGGKLAISRVGHSYMKAAMVQQGAIFGGEHSGHYYFRDFWCADTGLLAALHVLQLVGCGDSPMSDLVASLPAYAASGELNFAVSRPAEAMDRVVGALGGQGVVEWRDGLSVRGAGWWLSLRRSNTEPLLRLNVEATDPNTMTSLRDLARAAIEGI
jgi:phosphomannomutase